MLICRVECVAEIHEKRVTLPSEASLDVRIRHASSMKEIGCCNSKGMACPTGKRLVLRIQVEDSLSRKPKKTVNLRRCNKAER
mmetsp:Transcript_22726/g.29205  ORF Transcript_22726/g.29205 Transcript_22726/m.29205 type:complete len:83 (-) Transcript_22726:160-408(-)